MVCESDSHLSHGRKGLVEDVDGSFKKSERQPSPAPITLGGSQGGFTSTPPRSGRYGAVDLPFGARLSAHGMKASLQNSRFGSCCGAVRTIGRGPE